MIVLDVTDVNPSIQQNTRLSEFIYGMKQHPVQSIFVGLHTQIDYAH